MTTATIRAMKQTDETKNDQTVPIAQDAELFLDLDAGAAYWIELCLVYRVSAYYAARINQKLAFDGTLYDPGIHVAINAMPCYYTTAYQNRGSIAAGYAVSQAALATERQLINDSTESAAFRGMCSYSGRITTTTAGRLALWWKHYDNGAGTPSSSVIYAGSWLYATPLDICPII